MANQNLKKTVKPNEMCYFTTQSRANELVWTTLFCCCSCHNCRMFCISLSHGTRWYDPQLIKDYYYCWSFYFENGWHFVRTSDTIDIRNCKVHERLRIAKYGGINPAKTFSESPFWCTFLDIFIAVDGYLQAALITIDDNDDDVQRQR